VSFLVLGPLSVRADGNPVPIPSGKQRVLLAALLLKANQVVPVDELVQRLWDCDFPDRPRRALHTCLARLRHTLTRHGAELSARIHTEPGGYLIQLAQEELDLARFRAFASDSRSMTARQDPVREAAALGRAMALCRGDLLLDVESDSLHREVIPQLTEDMLRVFDRYYEVGLTLGRHHELVGELRALTLKYPLHERLRQHLMLALYRCGRRAEALDVYIEMTHHMRDMLGMDPCPELRQLHLEILRGDVAPSVASGEVCPDIS
jgi:DNA-binding SARP family transcriptional activator